MNGPGPSPIFLAKLFARLFPGEEDPFKMDPVKAKGLGREPNPQKILDEIGILPQQMARDSTLSRRIYERITPRGYDKRGESRAIPGLAAILGFEVGEPREGRDNPDREDAWRMFLGLPQEASTLAISKFKPTRSEDPNAVYYSYEGVGENLKATTGAYTVNQAVRNLRKTWEEKGGKPIVKSDVVIETPTGRKVDPNQSGLSFLFSMPPGSKTTRGIMGDFTIDFGKDEKGHYLSYYDRWDLGDPDSPIRKFSEMVGKPFEIYDRIYYDPKTFRIIEPGTRSRRRRPSP